MITQIWNKYTNNPIVTGFETKTSSIYEIPFPAVTICPEKKSFNFKFNYSDIFNKIVNQQKVADHE